MASEDNKLKKKRKVITVALMTLMLTFLAVIIISTNISPYNIWINNKIEELVASQNCSAQWTFSALGKLEGPSLKQDDMYQNLENILLDKKFKDFKTASIGNVKLGESVSLGVTNSGVITYDFKEPKHGGGNRFILPTIGQFDLKNSKLNVTNILAAGLAYTKNIPLVILGDVGHDVVQLDGCLKWSFPQKVKTEEGGIVKWKLIATDSIGETRTVEIEEGLKTKLLKKSQINEWVNYAKLFGDNTQVELKKNPSKVLKPKPISSQKKTDLDPKEKTRILAWGANNAGQLGNGLKAEKTITSLWATEVEKILKPNFDILVIDGGVYTTCLLRSDKTVWCWGGGDTHNKNSTPPEVKKVEGLPPITSINMGAGYNYCGKTDEGKIWCWRRRGVKASPIGYNWQKRSVKKKEYQKLRSSFIDAYPGMTDTCAKTNTEKLWCWGKNHGNEPVSIPLSKKPLKVSVGKSQTCAILEDYSAWCWANSTTPDPKSLFAKADKVKQLFSGWGEGCALKENGTVWCWKALGWQSRPVPNKNIISKIVKTANQEELNGIQKLDNQGNTLFCALRKDKTVWCWGNTGGNPTQEDKKHVTQIKGPNGICNITNVSDITVGAWSGYALIKSSEEFIKRLEDGDRSLEIFAAIQAGDFKKAKELLSKKPCLTVDTKLAQSALLTAIRRQEVQIVKSFIDAGIDLELPHYENNTALLYASGTFIEVNENIVKMLIDAGADINAEGVHKSTVLTNLQRKQKNKNIAKLVLNKLKKQEERTLYTHPLKSLEIETLQVTRNTACTAGKMVLPKSGKYTVNIPSGCNNALVKIWGASGGGTRGGKGGFTVDIIDISKAQKVEAIVGGAGKSGAKGAQGMGGFNGGGHGGEGGIRPDYRWGSGSGGGGRSEIIIDGKAIVIAGGGGGQGREARSLPGGGQNTEQFMKDFSKYVGTRTFSYLKKNTGKPGGNGIGGAAGFKGRVISGCTKATPGASKNGGNGSRVLNGEACGAAGGGGGGAGFGGGGGGGHDSGGAGGGGGGRSSEFGISLWGGFDAPANMEDPDYKAQSDEFREDGLIVISWPAPKPEDLLQHLTAILPYQTQHRFKTVEEKEQKQKQKQKQKEIKVSDSEKILQATKERETPYDPEKRYASYGNIPDILKRLIRNQTKIKSYLDNIERQFSRATNGHNLMNLEVLKEIENEIIKNARKRQRVTILNYDDDLDGIVTRREVTNHFEKLYNRHSRKRTKTNVSKYVDKAMTFDKDNDQVISSKEMLVLDSGQKLKLKKHLSKTHGVYLELDPNQNNELTISELRSLAQKAFVTADLDADQVISTDEYKSLRDRKKSTISFPEFNNITEHPKIAKTARMIKTIEAAVATFRDIYDAPPGDVANSKRIANCKPSSCVGGNGDGVVGDFNPQKIKINSDERHMFWVHLSKANLLSGYDEKSTQMEWRKAFLASPLGGGFHVYAHDGMTKIPHSFSGTSARRGLYLMLSNAIDGDLNDNNAHLLTADQASRLDRKLDDGSPVTGSIIAVGDKKCIESFKQTPIYRQSGKQNEKCLSLLVRLQSYEGSRKIENTTKRQLKRLQNTAEITQYPSSLSTSLVRMIISGTKVEDVYFDTPKSIDKTGNLEQYVFSSSGGSAIYKTVSRESMSHEKEGDWVFSSGWNVSKIGTSENDVLAFLPHISYEMCKDINENTNLSSKDNDGDGIPKGSAKSILPSFSNNMVKENPGISSNVDMINEPPFIGRPFGCYDLSDGNGKPGDGPYLYYHVLIER